MFWIKVSKIELPMEQMKETYRQIEGFHYISSYDGTVSPLSIIKYFNLYFISSHIAILILFTTVR